MWDAAEARAEKATGGIDDIGTAVGLGAARNFMEVEEDY